MSITQEAREEVERLIRQGNKLQAIKYLHDTFSISLADAKLLVDTLASELGLSHSNTTESIPFTGLHGEDRMTVQQLLQSGNKIEAIKFVQGKFKLGLKESMTQVEIIQQEIDPTFRPSKRNGCAVGLFRVFGFLFAFVGIVLLGFAAIVYGLDASIVKDENKTEGVVIELTGDDTMAPIIAYNWKGQSLTYKSTLYSNPPDFVLHERVALYVNPEKPEEVIVDTFSERWLGIVILAVIGGVFTFLSIIFFFTSRKF